MEVLHVRNVNHAYWRGLGLLQQIGERSTSRNGDVLVAPHPVTTVYDRPTERVLFNEARNANPFFHLFESLWMLGGRRDAEYLNQFVRDFGSRYAEEDGMLWGAYGNRWREWFGEDQLQIVVDRLRRDFNDRRSVITMWDPVFDLIGPEDRDEDDTLTWPEAEPRDLPCNTQIYLRVRGGVLDLTVTCRSNDIVWGAYGANAVHFSVLQEYLAAAIGCGIGKMYQVSNNWHGYLASLPGDFDTADYGQSSVVDAYIKHPSKVAPTPMVTYASLFLEDVKRFLVNPVTAVYANVWFVRTAVPMLLTHRAYKDGDIGRALDLAMTIGAADWRLACQLWLGRKMK